MHEIDQINDDFAVTQSCSTDSGIMMYKVEFSVIPDLDKILPPGCFGIMYLGKLVPREFKLLPNFEMKLESCFQIATF